MAWQTVILLRTMVGAACGKLAQQLEEVEEVNPNNLHSSQIAHTFRCFDAPNLWMRDFLRKSKSYLPISDEIISSNIGVLLEIASL